MQLLIWFVANIEVDILIKGESCANLQERKKWESFLEKYIDNSKKRC
jgi:hypothetical protein